MAQRGAKPAPVKLRLVTGAHRTARHGDTKKAEQAVAAAEKAFGKGLVPPKSFKGEALAAWRRYIVPAAGWTHLGKLRRSPSANCGRSSDSPDQGFRLRSTASCAPT
jgi:hypothetical protein